MPKSNWSERKLDAEFLLDSGLLFEINRTCLHPLGMAFVVRTEADGVKTLQIKDLRSEPEKAVFDKTTVQAGTQKLQTFLKEFGSAQMSRRRKHNGWAVQP